MPLEHHDLQDIRRFVIGVLDGDESDVLRTTMALLTALRAFAATGSNGERQAVAIALTETADEILSDAKHRSN